LTGFDGGGVPRCHGSAGAGVAIMLGFDYPMMPASQFPAWRRLENYDG